MTIGFDAKRAFLNATGLGNYSRTIIQNMCTTYPDYSFYAFTPKAQQNIYFESLAFFDNLEILTAPKFMPKSMWRSWGIVNNIQEKDLDVYHGLSNELPINAHKMSCKKLVTIHDLIFESHPQYYKPIDRKIYHYKFKNACQIADTIIATSLYTKNAIENTYKINPSKIQVLYQDAPAIFKHEYSSTQLEYVKQKYQLPDYFILQVGTIEERKNAKDTILALKHSKFDLPLVIVGRATDYQKELEAIIAQEQLSQRVVFLHRVGFYDLPLIYKQALAFIYPSKVEGFGIPILEALYTGVPVVAASGSCLEEPGGKLALYYTPNQPEALAHQIDEIISGSYELDPEALQQHLQQFDQKLLTQQLMNLYQST